MVSSLEAETDPAEVVTLMIHPAPVLEPELLELPVLEVQENDPASPIIQSNRIKLFQKQDPKFLPFSSPIRTPFFSEFKAVDIS
jgi:hypothetical protein